LAHAFFLRSLAEQVARLDRKVEREKIVLAALPELSLQIAEVSRPGFDFRQDCRNPGQVLTTSEHFRVSCRHLTLGKCGRATS
jgi:hypothetical protein